MQVFAVVSGILSLLTLFGLIVSALKPVRKIITKSLFAGTICLLRHEITSLYYRLKQTGVIRPYEREDLIRMYSQYEKLGGNCYIKTIVEEMLKIPVSV